jgi:hypothetical protein
MVFCCTVFRKDKDNDVIPSFTRRVCIIVLLSLVSIPLHERLAYVLRDVFSRYT